MRLIAVLIGCLPLLLLEIGLRVTAEPTAESVDFDPVADLHQLKPLFVLDQETDRWKIPETRYNFFRPASFAATKPATTRRIFVLGGSTVQGRPYETETAFSTWLRLRMQAADPDHDYEVVNCGGVSYASYRIAKILEEVLDHSPDAIVVYTGHNEFLESQAYANVRELGTVRRWVSRLGAKLHTVRWLQSLGADKTDLGDVVLDGATTDDAATFSAEVDARLDHPGGLVAYHRDPSGRKLTEARFMVGLNCMVAAANAADVPLVLCLPASDIVDTPPFKIQMDPNVDSAAFEKNWQIASHLEASPDERLAAAEACLEIDPEHAGAHYVKAQLKRSLQQPSRDSFIAARDFDVCPLRASTTIINSIRRIAEANDVPLVDTLALLDQRNLKGQSIPDGIADPEYFVDHLHPSIVGHQLIGQEVARKFAKLGIINPSDQAESRYARLQQEHLASLREDYFLRGKQRLAGLKLWTAGRAGQLGTGDVSSSEE